jgi:hypothetical protein
MEMLKALGGDALMAYEVNMEKAPSHLGDLMDVPLNVRNGKTEKAKIKKAMAQQVTAQQGGDPAAAGAAMDQQETSENG